jgi:hypothetical protein
LDIVDAPPPMIRTPRRTRKEEPGLASQFLRRRIGAALNAKDAAVRLFRPAASGCAGGTTA